MTQAQDNKSVQLFLLGCLPSRILLVFLAYKFPKILPLMGVVALCISAGFAIIYIGGLRKTGPEVFGGEIWWNDLRPIHATLYFLFGLLALKKSRYAWCILLLDIFIGSIAFINKHFQ